MSYPPWFFAVSVFSSIQLGSYKEVIPKNFVMERRGGHPEGARFLREEEIKGQTDLKGQPVSAEDRPLMLHYFIYTGSLLLCQ